MIKNQYIISTELMKDQIDDENMYPFNLPIVNILDKIEFHPNVTFLTWDNWTGKSTLLEAIAIEYGFNPEWGSRNTNFSTQDSHSSLSSIVRTAKGIKRPKDSYFLRAESFYNLATNIDEIEKEYWWMYDFYWSKSLHEQSHGESFFSLFKHRLSWKGLYIFDEPEAALSPEKQLALLVRMNELVNDDSQFIIVTHSPIILSYPKAKILQISKEWLEEVKYKDSNNYQLYKMFIDNPDNMINKLGIGD